MKKIITYDTIIIVEVISLIEDKGEKRSIFFVDLDLIFVYLTIFLAGVGVMVFMATYLNIKVQEYNGVLPMDDNILMINEHIYT